MQGIFKGPTNVIEFVCVNLLHSNLPHASATHVATFKVVRTRINYTISYKDPRVYTYIINATLLTLNHPDMFRSSKGHLQGVRHTFQQQGQENELPDIKF